MEEQADRQRWIILAVFALVAVGVVGGDPDLAQRRRRRATRRSADRRRPAPTAARKSKRRNRRKSASKRREQIVEEGRRSDRGGGDQLRHLRDRPRHRPRAEDRQLLRLPGRRRLLRRPHLPPDRARLRDPGRRSAQAPAPAAPATTSTRNRPPTSPTRKAWWRWRRARPSRPARSGSQFYVVTGADAGLPPEYALVGKVSEGLDVVERIGKLGTPERKTETDRPDRNDHDRTGLAAAA